jgi:putative CRISPR-associated protein (TIGR02619 family)
VKRIVITSVGASLLDKAKEEEWIALRKLSKWAGLIGYWEWMNWLESLRNQLDGAGTPDGYENWDHLQSLSDDDPAKRCAQGIVDLMGAVWRSDLPEKDKKGQRSKRSASPAEIASLGLMDPKPGEGDTVILLYSDTSAGAWCATVLERAMAPVFPAVKIGKQRVPGLKHDDLKLFEDEAVGKLAGMIAGHFFTHVRPGAFDSQLVLNFTGGFKASIPVMTLVAGLLLGAQERADAVKMTCLYEESPDLFWQPLTPITLKGGLNGPIAARLVEADWMPDANHPNRGWLRCYPKAEDLQQRLDEAERNFYATSGISRLSSLGQALREVLLASPFYQPTQ